MIIIGEKINGSIPSVAEAIAKRDAEFIKDRARKQAEAGATFIDCCASVPEEEEVETLKWMIDCIQEVTDLPISVDSPSADVLVQAYKFCKRPGLFNSVSGEGDKIDKIFPVMAQEENKGWEVIALLSDDTGIPKNATDRLRVFDKIMEKAKEYGISPSRIHIDPLVEMLCTSENGIETNIEVITSVREQYPSIHITAAISNISFNLPVRKLINLGFMVLAMNAGMDSAIVDPTNKNMIGMIYATNALLERDEYCLDYIDKFKDKPAQEAVPVAEAKELTPAEEKMQAVWLQGVGQLQRTEFLSCLRIQAAFPQQRSFGKEIRHRAGRSLAFRRG